MKRISLVLAAALLLGATNTAVAQNPQPAGQPQAGGRRGNMMSMLMEGITLTAEQQARVDSVQKKYADQRQSMMGDESMDRDARRAKMREMMTKMSDELRAVLTDEQRAVFDKNMADMRARRSGGGR